MNEHGNTNPGGLESLLSNFMGGGQSYSTSTGQQLSMCRLNRLIFL